MKMHQYESITEQYRWNWARENNYNAWAQKVFVLSKLMNNRRDYFKYALGTIRDAR